MANSPPKKRQRRFVVLSSDDDEDDSYNQQHSTKTVDDRRPENSQNGTNLVSNSATSGGYDSSLSLGTTARLSQNKKRPVGILNSPSKASSFSSTRTTPASSPDKKNPKPRIKKTSEPSGKSLRTFFQPATEEERWSRADREKSKRSQREKTEEIENEILEDIIEDDEICDFLDAASSQQRHPARKNPITVNHGYPPLDRRKSSIIGTSRNGGAVGKVEKSTRPAKRFILNADDSDIERGSRSFSQTSSSSSSLVPSAETIQKPWAEQFAPVNLGELAVHKKKVSDVQKWLTEVFMGRSRRRILVLKGPAGSGKSTTISLLSKTLGYDIIEWKNSSGAEYTSTGYTSMGMQFDDFLGRGDKFDSLELDHGPTAGMSNDSNASKASKHRAILIEEFPALLSPGSSGLIAFRSSLHRYLASAVPPLGRHHSSNLKPGPGFGPPIIIIVSETLLGTGSSLSDNFTVHRLLGPELSNHPGVSIIEFNPIAPTIISKALDLVLKKEARLSKRKRVPGSGVLKRLSELGDIRSAIYSLEFMCLQGGVHGGWSGIMDSRVKATGKSSTQLKMMESESLEMVTQREASLGIFHAVGKVVYNKRDPISTQASAPNGLDISQPSTQLRRKPESLVSQVSVDDLINETGTDIQTFIAALHENYVLSCDGYDFIDHFESCAEFLSEADVLSPENRWNRRSNRGGVGGARQPFQGSGTSIDLLRQDEMGFHVAVRGLLFSLPYPVKRRAYKMLFPNSLRLWRRTEELEGQLDIWIQRLTDPNTSSGGSSSLSTRSEGVESWKRRTTFSDFASGDGDGDGDPQTQSPVISRCMISRDQLLLERLPYMNLISKDLDEIKEIQKLTRFSGMISGDQDLAHDDLADVLEDPSNTEPWNTDRIPSSFQNRRQRMPPPSGTGSALPSSTLPVEVGVDSLVLSDDDIEDD